MFNFIKAIKIMQRDAKSFNEELELDEQGRYTIHVDIEQECDIYSKYSPDNHLRLDSELKDYFASETEHKKIPLKVSIYSDELFNDTKKQEDFKATYKSDFERERLRAYGKLHSNNTACLLYLLIGLSILAISLFIPSIHIFGSQVINLSIEILAWVFLWEVFDRFFFVRPELRNEYIHLLKLTVAEINFNKRIQN